MKVKWLLEKDVFEDNLTERMISEIKFQGMEAHVVPYVPFDDDLVDRCSKLFDEGDCVVFYGSLNFGKKLQATSWCPGVYLDEKEFECTSYYPAIGDLLIHYKDFMMLPYGTLYDMKDMLFDRLGFTIFIRPNSGTKEFTGFVTTPTKFDERVKLAGFYDVEPNLLCLAAKAHELNREWRFVVVNGKVISGSLYRAWGEYHCDDPQSPDYVLSHSFKHDKELHEVGAHRDEGENKAWEVAQQAADRANHRDRAWTVDVCETKDREVKVLEIGCFSCAGLYANNLRRVIKEVSKAALEEWKEIYE